MLTRRYTADEALRLIRSKRPYSEPNPGFMRQLKEFEREIQTLPDAGKSQTKGFSLEPIGLHNRTTEQMIEELAHCQRLVQMQENKYRPLRVNYKGQIRRVSSTVNNDRVMQPSFPQMQGHIVTSTKNKPPLDPSKTTFQMAAGISLTQSVRNNSQRPPLKTGNAVADASRQLQQLRRWEDSLRRSQKNFSAKEVPQETAIVSYVEPADQIQPVQTGILRKKATDRDSLPRQAAKLLQV